MATKTTRYLVDCHTHPNNYHEATRREQGEEEIENAVLQLLYRRPAASEGFGPAPNR